MEVFQGVRGAGNPPPMMRNDAPPPYTHQPSGGVSNDELFRRQEELEKKAQELRRREEELERRQRQGGGGGGRCLFSSPVFSFCLSFNSSTNYSPSFIAYCELQKFTTFLSYSSLFFHSTLSFLCLR